MNNSLIKPSKQETVLDRERRRMQESLALLEPVREARHKGASSPKRKARLIFGLDLTASREWSLDQARLATAGMLAAIQDIGSVAVKLVYYRGLNECRESPWYDDMARLCRSMMGLACESGGTQIGRILKCALREFELLSGVVFIGDACEESHRELEVLAAKLGQAQVPLFIFHECGEDRRSRDAKRLFKRMAQLSGGAYIEFHQSGDRVLRELLTNVAAYAANGPEAVERMAFPSTEEGRQLRDHLLLGSGR
jgi:hypothetical protein